MIDAAGGIAVVALRFLALTATIGTLGAWVFGRFVVGRLTGELDERHGQSLERLSLGVAIGSAALLVLCAVPRLLAQATFTMPGDPLWPTALTALRTRWGWGLAAQTVVAAVACATLLLRRHRQEWPPIAVACVAGLVVLPAFLGHAGAAAEMRLLSVTVDVAHVAAAGGWVGTLGLLTTAALRARHSADGPALFDALIVAFHPVAMVAASTVFLTGLLTAWLRMGLPVGIASSSYSGLFVAKLLLVGVTAALGAGHARQAKRRVRVAEVGSTSRTLLTETLLAVLVLVITALLAGTDPIA